MVAYVPDHAGLAEIGKSWQLSDAVVDAAERGQAWAAGRDRRGNYVVRRVTLPAGRKGEPRVGAVLEDNGPDALRREGSGHTLAMSVNVIESEN